MGYSAVEGGQKGGFFLYCVVLGGGLEWLGRDRTAYQLAIQQVIGGIDVFGDERVVTDDDKCCAVLSGGAAEQPKDAAGGARIEARGWLVGKDQRGLWG